MIVIIDSEIVSEIKGDLRQSASFDEFTDMSSK
jgi:hypothetical protein